jgi:hypothetical protein
MSSPNKPPVGRYFHVSCFANMVPDPRGLGSPAIPYIEKPGVTFKRGDTPRTDPRDKRGFLGRRRIRA